MLWNIWVLYNAIKFSILCRKGTKLGHFKFLTAHSSQFWLKKHKEGHTSNDYKNSNVVNVSSKSNQESPKINRVRIHGL